MDVDDKNLDLQTNTLSPGNVSAVVAHKIGRPEVSTKGNVFI